jgi:hypothetical protein
MKRFIHSSKPTRGLMRLARLHRGKIIGVVGAFMAIVLVLFGLAARAFNVSTASESNLKNAPLPPPAVRDASQPLNALHGRLSLQPEANKMRRRLGQRFVVKGHEVSVLTGTLVRGNETRPIVIRREQREDGERLTIILGGSPNLSWDQADGPSAPGRTLDEDTRFLIDRLALDGPDQFILAQLRGAGYYVIARDVMPEEASGNENYNGPVWDVVRVGESDSAVHVKAHSPWHLYYINSSSGLIDRVITTDQGAPVIAELSAWVSVGGEIIPTHITWSRNQQVVMELNVINGQFGARQ